MNFNLLRKIIITILAGIFLTSCLGVKFLKENEQILKSQKVIGVKPALKDEADNLFTQRKNTKLFFGIPIAHLVYLYKLGENGFIFKGYDKHAAIEKKEIIKTKYDDKLSKIANKKKYNKVYRKKTRKLDRIDKKINEGNLFMRWGEPLAIYNHDKAIQTAEKIKIMMQNNGYFQAKVFVDTSRINHSEFKKAESEILQTFTSQENKNKNHFIDVIYHIIPNKQYMIDSLIRVVKDEKLKQLIDSYNKKLPLKNKKSYNQNTFSEERETISNIAQNNGYFTFSKQLVSFLIDSITLKNHKLIVKEIVNAPKEKRKIFTIDSVIYTGSSYKKMQDSLKKPTFYDGITFVFGKTKYSKKELSWRIKQRAGQLYSKELTDETQKQLTYLNIFRFNEIQYDTTNNQMIANIFTSPIDKYQTSFEAGLSSSFGIPGPFLNTSIINRNSFNGMEITSINATAKLEDLGYITESDTINQELYSRVQYGTNLSITFPKFLFPFRKKFGKKISSYSPTSILSFGLNFENRLQFYKRSIISSSFEYKWRVKDKLFYSLKPFSISYIKSENEKSFYQSLLELEQKGSTYINSFKSGLVNSSSAEMDLFFGKYQNNNTGGVAKLLFEIGGHYNGLFAKNDNLSYYNYIKFNIDFRRIRALRNKLKVAYRFNFGFAQPTFESDALPYEKYFFAGGSSSIRAWKPRRLGPGAYASFDKDGKIDYSREEPGEILIVSSFEIRQKLAKFTEIAGFIDAGNVWASKTKLIKETADPEGDDGKFRFNTFLSELAIGTGLGLRFDLSFLILRADFAIKMVDPAYPKGKRWVLNKFFDNIADQSEFNIAIGYPF